MIMNTIFGGSLFNYSTMGPKTLFYLLWPLYYVHTVLVQVYVSTGIFLIITVSMS